MGESLEILILVMKNWVELIWSKYMIFRYRYNIFFVYYRGIKVRYWCEYNYGILLKRII